MNKKWIDCCDCTNEIASDSYTNVYKSQQVPEKVQFSSLSGMYMSSLLSILNSIVSSAVGQPAGQLVGFQPSKPDRKYQSLQNDSFTQKKADRVQDRFEQSIIIYLIIFKLWPRKELLLFQSKVMLLPLIYPTSRNFDMIAIYRPIYHYIGHLHQ